LSAGGLNFGNFKRANYFARVKFCHFLCVK